MIRNPDFGSFVCCALCSKLLSTPPSPATFDRIREYKPFKTRYYTHQDILEIGAGIQQELHNKKEAEIQERIEKMKAELWSQGKNCLRPVTAAQLTSCSSLDEATESHALEQNRNTFQLNQNKTD